MVRSPNNNHYGQHRPQWLRGDLTICICGAHYLAATPPLSIYPGLDTKTSRSRSGREK